MIYEINLLTVSKLNIVAFVRDKEHEKFTMSPERPAPWVEVVPQQEVIDGYPGWGNDAKIILENLKEPSRWAIHTLYPPLETFVDGKIVLVGDAVGNVGRAFGIRFLTLFFRLMECSPISAQVQGKVLKTFMPFADS